MAERYDQPQRQPGAPPDFIIPLSSFGSYGSDDEAKVERSNEDARLLESFDPIGPKEPESLHSWDWLLSKWNYLRFILNERLREVSRPW